MRANDDENEMETEASKYFFTLPKSCVVINGATSTGIAAIINHDHVHPNCVSRWERVRMRSYKFAQIFNFTVRLGEGKLVFSCTLFVKYCLVRSCATIIIPVLSQSRLVPGNHPFLPSAPCLKSHLFWAISRLRKSGGCPLSVLRSALS